MAEYMMKHLLRERGLSDDFEVASAATSTEELGNPVYPPARRLLGQFGIRCDGHVARQLTPADYSHYDLLIGMDQWNIRNMLRITGGDPKGKIHRLMDFTPHPRDIDDPWYTRDFDSTYRDISLALPALIEHFKV